MWAATYAAANVFDGYNLWLSLLGHNTAVSTYCRVHAERSFPHDEIMRGTSCIFGNVRSTNKGWVSGSPETDQLIARVMNFTTFLFERIFKPSGCAKNKHRQAFELAWATLCAWCAFFCGNGCYTQVAQHTLQADRPSHPLCKGVWVVSRLPL